MKLLCLIVMVIVFTDSIWSRGICELNKNVLKSLEKSVGLYERNYLLVTLDDFKGYKYLECTVFHLNSNLILRYTFLFYFSFFNLIFLLIIVRNLQEFRGKLGFYKKI